MRHLNQARIFPLYLRKYLSLQKIYEELSPRQVQIMFFVVARHASPVPDQVLHTFWMLPNLCVPQ